MRLHNRQIKSDFWTDTELLKNLPMTGRMVYLGLIQLADDSGCLDDDVFAFKIQLFPADSITQEEITEFLHILINLNKVIPYESEGKNCLYLKNFHKHQSLDNPTKPSVPLPEWIRWEVYPSNKRSGKYIVSDFRMIRKNYTLQNTCESITNPLQVPSNYNQNLNLNNKISSSESIDSDKQEFVEDDPKPEKQKKTFAEDTEEYKLAAYMRECILKNLPDAKVPELDKLAKWCKDIDYLIRIDKREYKQIHEVIKWATSDTFWSANILSPGKLREKWDMLKAKMLSANKKQIVQSQSTAPQKGNFEQRKYDDAYYDKLYENV